MRPQLILGQKRRYCDTSTEGKYIYAFNWAGCATTLRNNFFETEYYPITDFVILNKTQKCNDDDRYLMSPYHTIRTNKPS